VSFLCRLQSTNTRKEVIEVQMLEGQGTKSFEVEIDGKQVTIKTGRLAKQASGACEVYCGDTMVLVTATQSKEARDGIDFFPLLIDYEEKLYAVGRVPGSFLRREGRAPDRAILTSRLIDRPIRPLFDYTYRKDVQVVATAMSADQVNPPDTLAMLGASVAIGLGGLPFAGPLGAVRVARVKGKLIANPTYEQIDESDMDIVVAGTADSIMMVEAGCKLVSEKDVLAAIDYGHTQIKKQVALQVEFFKALGVEPKPYEQPAKNDALNELIHAHCTEALKNSMNRVTDKGTRAKFIDESYNNLVSAIAELPEEHELKTVSKNTLKAYLEEYEAELMRASEQPRDTVLCDAGGQPALGANGQMQLKSIRRLVHDRLLAQPFPRLAEFDLEAFVDYGRAYYDNNAWVDDGRRFTRAERANQQREKQRAKAEKAALAASKRRK